MSNTRQTFSIELILSVPLSADPRLQTRDNVQAFLVDALERLGARVEIAAVRHANEQ